MTKLSEEKELKTITSLFTKAVKAFTNRKYEDARRDFQQIIESYGGSEHYSVLEISGRSSMYLKMVEAQLNPQKIELKGTEDYLNEGVFQLNAGRMDRAIELFEKVAGTNEKDAYLNFLFALAYSRKKDFEEMMTYLERCIGMDEQYKVIAFNEPDFQDYLEEKSFRELVT